MSNDFVSSNTYVVLRGNDLSNFNIVDEYFRDMAKQSGAVEYQIPALIDHDVLQKCGYFSSFPHHLTVAAHANPNMFQQVTEDKTIKKETALLSNQYFTPAACLHIYPMLDSEEIKTRLVTTKARVYRYENNNFNGSTRLWDFTVREIVFIGNKEFVLEQLQYVREKALEYAQTIGLPANIVSATDNFYPTKRNSVKQKIQISNSLKFELVVPVDKNDVAISSFNFHDSHFSKPFNFDKCGEIVTGCVGFGLERWVAALRHYQIVL